jgi:hypothetical protein
MSGLIPNLGYLKILKMASLLYTPKHGIVYTKKYLTRAVANDKKPTSAEFAPCAGHSAGLSARRLH